MSIPPPLAMNRTDYNYLAKKRIEFNNEHAQESEMISYIAPMEPSSHSGMAFQIALKNTLETGKTSDHSAIVLETFEKLYVRTGITELVPFPMDIFVISKTLILPNFRKVGKAVQVSLEEYCKFNDIPFSY